MGLGHAICAFAVTAYLTMILAALVPETRGCQVQVYDWSAKAGGKVAELRSAAQL